MPGLTKPPRPRHSWALAVFSGLALVGCAAPNPLSRHVNQCLAGGHAPGSPDFALCMSRTEPDRVSASDEERERRRWEARLERERVAAERRVRDEQRSVIGMNR